MAGHRHDARDPGLRTRQPYKAAHEGDLRWLGAASGLFFANAEHVRATIRSRVGGDTKAIVLDAETMPFVDVSAARMLEELAEDLRRDGVALVLARDVGQVQRRPAPRGGGGTPRAGPPHDRGRHRRGSSAARGLIGRRRLTRLG